MIEIMLCARCNIGDFLENLNGMLIHPDGRDEPYTEGPYCDECVEARRKELGGPGSLPGTVRDVQKLQRVREEGEKND